MNRFSETDQMLLTEKHRFRSKDINRMYTGFILRNMLERQRFYIFMVVKVDYEGRHREDIPLSFTDSRKNESSTKASFTFTPQLFYTD